MTAGKYPYAFNFDIRKPGSKEVLNVEPSSGTIAPGASAEVKVQYCSGKLSTLRDVKDVRCKISEPLTGEVRIVGYIETRWTRETGVRSVDE